MALVLLIGVVSCSDDAGAPSPASDASVQWEDFDRIDAAPDGGEPRDAESPPPDAQVLDAAFDAAIPAAWGEMPALCPNPIEYDEVRPDAFELIYVTGGVVYGAGRLEGESVDVLGIKDPSSTESKTAGAILRFDANARSYASLDTQGSLVLEFWQSPLGSTTAFAFESRPDYDAPGCLGPAIGSAVVAFEIDGLAEGWVPTVRGCLDYSAYWQRELITDTDGDGLPEILTSEIPRLDELNPDGTFTKLREGARDGVYPRRVPESISLGSADLDGDGFAEFSVSTSFREGPPELFGRGALRIMEYDPAVGYVVRHQAIAPFYLPYWQATGDVDGDGHPELLYGGPADNCRWLGLYHAIANDTYALKWGGSFNDPEGFEINEARMGDTDGDGDDEVILPSGCHVRVLEWNGTGLVQVGDIPVGEHCDEPNAFPADLDGDGADEVVVTTRWGSAEYYVDPTGVVVWKRRRDLP